MAERPAGPSDLPLRWRGGRHITRGDPTVQAVGLNHTAPDAFEGPGAPRRSRRPAPSALVDEGGARVTVQAIDPADPPPASGRVRLRR